MKKALFLDRDGIINVDHGYAYKIDEFEFIPEIFELCQQAIAQGFVIIVITNQSGIGRGKYSEEDFLVLTQWMKAEFKANNVIIEDVYFCPHHPTNAFGEYLQECQCRKPAPGMITKAVLEHNIDTTKSIFIGDKVSDMQAAQAGSIGKCILVASQYPDESLNNVEKVNALVEAMPYIV
jgi:D-glycero-D-manno-heptose 1,7-bisphosphate phosphatase